MSIAAGTWLGTYEIRALIGAGGMGEVYEAHDTKLDRDVAIKVLPERFSRDSERLARFQREAKLLAALNHPNIAAIYGLEQSGSTHYLVMELVPGQTLRERVAGGRAIPVEEALTIANFEVGAVKPLFQTTALNFGGRWPYDVSADGQRFLINTLPEQAGSAPITVVVNWMAGMRK